MQTEFNLRESIVDAAGVSPLVNNNIYVPTISNGLTGRVRVALPTVVSGLTGLTPTTVLAEQQQPIWNQASLLSEISRQPRLFPISGPNEQIVEKVIEQIRTVPTDLATHCLLQPTSVLPVGTHPCRGFTILNGSQQSVVQEIRKIEASATGGARPVCLVFNGVGSQWSGIGQELLTMDVFRQSILRSVEVLRPLGINLLDLIQERQQQRTLASFVAITAVQIALVDLLRHIGVAPEFLIGHSIGELACAYADACLSSEQALLAAYQCGKLIEDAQWTVQCARASVGLTWDETVRRCPQGVVPTWQQTQECVTVCGPRNLVVQFVKDLSYEGVHANVIADVVADVDETTNNGTIPLHSMYMNPLVSQLKQALDRIIVTPKLRSSRWISSSIPEQKSSSELARYFSPEYLVNNLCSPVLLPEALRRLSAGSNGHIVVVEVGPQASLQGLLRRTLGQQVPVIGLVQRGESSSQLDSFLTQLGKLYLEGVNLDALKLVVPVGREHALSPLPVHVTNGPFARWVKAEPPHQVQTLEPTRPLNSNVQTFKYSLDLEDEASLNGHQINGQLVYPTAGYLQLIWKSLAQLNGYQSFEHLPVSFENVEILRHTVIAPSRRQITFVVSIVPKTGQFELAELESADRNVIVTGRVSVVSPSEHEPIVSPTSRHG
jgi:fatty acid synthase